MTYGLLASGNCLLTDVVDQFHKNSHKVNSVERFTRQLNKGISVKALISYLFVIRKWIPNKPVIHIDDSDVLKSNGHKFQALGLAMDGSKKTSAKLKFDELGQDYVIRLTAKRKRRNYIYNRVIYK